LLFITVTEAFAQSVKLWVNVITNHGILHTRACHAKSVSTALLNSTTYTNTYIASVKLQSRELLRYNVPTLVVVYKQLTKITAKFIRNKLRWHTEISGSIETVKTFKKHS